MKDRVIILGEQLPETTGNNKNSIRLYLSNGYLSALHPKNFHGWFTICDQKGRRIRLITKR